VKKPVSASLDVPAATTHELFTLTRTIFDGRLGSMTAVSIWTSEELNRTSDRSFAERDTETARDRTLLEDSGCAKHRFVAIAIDIISKTRAQSRGLSLFSNRLDITFLVY